MLIGDMTAVKYELSYNCLSQSIMRSGLQDAVRRTVAKCEQYTGLHATDNWWCLFITECCTEGKLLTQRTVQVAAKPTIAIKQQQWTQSGSTQHM